MTAQTHVPMTPRPVRALSEERRTTYNERLNEALASTAQVQERLRAEMATALISQRGIGTDEAEDPEGPSIGFERAQAEAMLQLATQRRRDIEAALARLDAGTYGTCLECDSPIVPGRLEALPAAAFCVECAK